MTTVNGSFETATTGAHPGLADSWTRTVVATQERYAEFSKNEGDYDTSGQEDFERGWTPPVDQLFLDEFNVAALVSDFFGTTARVAEGFETEWGTRSQGEFALSAYGFAAFGAESMETFESGWGSTPFDFPDSTVIYLATFDTVPEFYEDFEEDWASFVFTLSSTSAFFTESPLTFVPYESFETSAFDLADVTVTPSTNRVDKIAHGLQLNDVITFYNEGGRLPDGILADTDYLVFSVTPDDFQIRAVLGGAAETIVDNGFGTHFVRHDPASWWVDELLGV